MKRHHHKDPDRRAVREIIAKHVGIKPHQVHGKNPAVIPLEVSKDITREIAYKARFYLDCPYGTTIGELMRQLYYKEKNPF